MVWKNIQNTPVRIPGVRNFSQQIEDMDVSDLYKVLQNKSSSLAPNTQTNGSFGQQFDVPFLGQNNMDPNNRGWQGWLFGGRGTDGTRYQGAAGPALNLLKGGVDTWMGLKQLGLAEDNLDFQKNAFSKQFGNQASLINTQLADRQRARVDRNPHNNMAVGEYMNKNAVSLG